MPVSIRMNPSYESLCAFVTALPDRFETDGTYVYGGTRNLIKSFRAPDGTLLNVKRYHRPALLNRLVYSSGIRRPKGERAFEYPQLLLPKGIGTPEPVAYIEERRCGLIGLSYFVSIHSTYSHTLYEMGDAPATDYEPMADALAAFTAHMHEQQVLHRDFSPGNILWEKDDAGYHFQIVDINRMRFGTVGMKPGCRNFARLWGPKRFISLLVRAYAEKRGFNPSEAEVIALAARKSFWTGYMKKREVEFKLEL